MPSKPNPSDRAGECTREYPQESALSSRTGDVAGGTRHSAYASSEPVGKRAVRSLGDERSTNRRSVAINRATEFYPAHVLHPRVIPDQLGEHVKKTLRVMKFGGTSVADAACIAKVAQIVRAAAHESQVVVVVSAMSGVTNKLVEAATHSEAGRSDLVTALFEELCKRHQLAASTLIRSAEQRQSISSRIQELIQDANNLCQSAILRGSMTPRERDSIAGLGERLSAPLVAAALMELEVTSEAVEATELVVTDACHGAAEPRMDLTRERCEARLRPLLSRGVVAVVTGFIGATVDGALTTLGRNSSDFSGTIMGGALDADEVTLWTDVDGILTADPKIVPGARSILAMSYREASDLAELGAKVLHPKTLQPVMQRGIPLLIRNTFAPERPGTKITAAGPSDGSDVKALAVTADVAMITVHGCGDAESQIILDRTVAAAQAVKADVRLIPERTHSSNEVSIVISSALAEVTIEALRREFESELAQHKLEHIDVDLSAAIVALVGESTLLMPELSGRVLRALHAEQLHVLASAQGFSQSSFSVVVNRQQMQPALIAIHQEFHRDFALSAAHAQEPPSTRS